MVQVPVYRALHRGNRPASGASEAKHIKFHTIKRIRALRSYDLGAALAVVKGIDKQSVHGLGSPVTPNALSRPAPDRIENTALILGIESATFYQRVPVPIGMWRPFSKDCVPLRL